MQYAELLGSANCTISEYGWISGFLFYCLLFPNFFFFLVILRDVLYGYGTWSVMFREKHRLKTFPEHSTEEDIRMKKLWVAEDWRKLRKEEIIDLYCSPNLVYMVNPLNAELNPICPLLILLGDLTFMGKCIVSISNKMQLYTVYLNLETALNVSGGTSTHHQERIQLYPQNLVFVTPLLLSATVVEELEQVLVCCGWLTPPTAHSNRFQLFHDSGR
jgi:hypothetical protein